MRNIERNTYFMKKGRKGAINLIIKQGNISAKRIAPVEI